MTNEWTTEVIPTTTEVRQMTVVCSQREILHYGDFELKWDDGDWLITRDNHDVLTVHGNGDALATKQLAGRLVEFMAEILPGIHV
jgi:hypothetical protein